MSGSDGRIKGKRFRKPMTGASNLRDRWKYLSADTDDTIGSKIPAMKRQSHTTTGKGRHGSSSSAAYADAPANQKSTRSTAAYDIDGDGQVDAREMRLAKFLDAMVEKRQRALPDSATEVSETELHRMRQSAGKLLIAKEFIERNQGQLWRYGSIFAEKNEDQSAEFIAAHNKFPKLIAFLESLERKRLIASSHHVRNAVNQDPHREEPSQFQRQTWVESVRKVKDSSFSRFPLPDLQPKPREINPLLIQDKDMNNNGPDYYDVMTNQYGAIDVDGDGVVDDDEMKLHLRLKEATLNDPSVGSQSAKEFRRQQQQAGRTMMATDFVRRNAEKLWHYDLKYKGRPHHEIIEEIASNGLFAKEFNKLRAKERVLTLKSSSGVAGCIVQIPAVELPNDPQNATEFRRVRDRSELLMARRELMKPPEQRMAALLAKNGTVPGTTPSLPFGAVREERQTATPLNRTRSEGELIGLPNIFENPRRMEPTGCFSVTKWKFEDH